MNLYVWYDNEFGYTCQVVRVIQKLAGIEHPVFPPLEFAHQPDLASEQTVEGVAVQDV